MGFFRFPPDLLPFLVAGASARSKRSRADLPPPLAAAAAVSSFASSSRTALEIRAGRAFLEVDGLWDRPRPRPELGPAESAGDFEVRAEVRRGTAVGATDFGPAGARGSSTTEGSYS